MKIIKYIFIFTLTRGLVLCIPLAAQDSTLLYNLNILNYHLQNLADSVQPLPIIELQFPAQIKTLARRMVLGAPDKDTPNSITYLINTQNNRLIMQEIAGVYQADRSGRSILKDFVTQLRQQYDIDILLFPILNQEHVVANFIVSFSDLPNNQKVSVLHKLLINTLQVAYIKTIIKDSLKKLGTITEGYESPYIVTKTNLLTVSEIVFLQLYFLGILVTVPDVQINTLQSAFNKSAIVNTLNKTIADAKKRASSVLVSETEENSLKQEYKDLKGRLETVATQYVIDNLPKRLKEFGNWLHTELEKIQL